MFLEQMGVCRLLPIVLYIVAPVACVLIRHALVTVLAVIIILSTAVQLTESMHFAIVDGGEGLASLLIASQCWVL